MSLPSYHIRHFSEDVRKCRKVASFSNKDGRKRPRLVRSVCKLSQIQQPLKVKRHLFIELSMVHSYLQRPLCILTVISERSVTNETVNATALQPIVALDVVEQRTSLDFSDMSSVIHPLSLGSHRLDKLAAMPQRRR